MEHRHLGHSGLKVPVLSLGTGTNLDYDLTPELTGHAGVRYTRSDQAFGAASVALGPGCADPHSPKAVRASMGAIFSVALARVHDIAELPGERVALVANARVTIAPRA